MIPIVEPGYYQKQTLDHKQLNKKETQAYNEIWQDYLRPQSRRERHIDDLHKITRGLQCSLKNSLSKINSKMGFKSYVDINKKNTSKTV